MVTADIGSPISAVTVKEVTWDAVFPNWGIGGNVNDLMETKYCPL